MYDLGDQDRAPINRAMNLYAEGDDAAFSILYAHLAPRLYRFLLRQTRGDEARAEDLMQQTFLHMHKARGSFIEGADVLPWSFAIARRLFIDSLRRKSRTEVFPNEENFFNQSIDESLGVEDHLHAKQVGVRIDQAVASLPEQQRIAFELIKRDELSVSEAAEVLGTTAGAVKLRAHRAYETLRQMLGDLIGQKGEIA